ncbi:MAG: hypothetical protein JSR21_01555 [Proteobacteria bacterium]|nr:hypothetical protein [Pseudomonadota bacterium]
MTTLTALKLERELQIARAAQANPPRLSLQWRICPVSGRPAATWVAEPPACALEHALATAALA